MIIKDIAFNRETDYGITAKMSKRNANTSCTSLLRLSCPKLLIIKYLFWQKNEYRKK